MTKITVETTGSFQLIDRLTRTLIAHDKPTEVELSPFVQEQLDAGQLREVGAKPKNPTPESPKIDPERENETPKEPEAPAEVPERENPKPRRQRRNS